MDKRCHFCDCVTLVAIKVPITVELMKRLLGGLQLISCILRVLSSETEVRDGHASAGLEEASSYI